MSLLIKDSNPLTTLKPGDRIRHIRYDGGDGLGLGTVVSVSKGTITAQMDYDGREKVLYTGFSTVVRADAKIAKVKSNTNLDKRILACLTAMNCSPAHAVSWIEPRSNQVTKLIAAVKRRIAASKEKP